MLKKKNVLILSLGFSLGVFIATSASVFAERETNVAPAKESVTIPYAELRAFTEIFGRIKRDYVEPIEDKKLLEDAIKGMLTGLDPHSSYLNKEGYKELMEGTKGQFGGLGIEVTMENGFVRVVSPIDDTPAQRAGIQAGDLIVKLDKKPVKGMSLGDAVKIMRGKPGEPITLTIIREGADAPVITVLKRAIIRVESVKSRLLEKNYGYVRISSFQSKTTESLLASIDELAKENEGALKGLVLDLRNNPGGLLRSAVGVSDAFLEKGLIVYTEGRIKNSKISFNAEAGDKIKGAPLVVLINAGSASASEIVSGALQDHKRAIIMGEKSFGKGSVQTILPTSNGAAIKLTTARYFTPLGRSIQAAGIKPDVVLKKLKLEPVKQSSYKPVKEADLSRHLENAEKFSEKELKKIPKADKKDKLSTKDDNEKGLKDYALHEALNLLKAISILK
ncbi:MAG: S41 family peptidase [Methylococcales bacterium]|nr:S41 family peptidase [Methylococcales bacterium]